MKLLLMLLLVPIVANLQAQTVLRRPTEQRSEYVLGPGDQINLHVADVEDISQAPIRVDPSGSIDLPLIGRIDVAGSTVDQLRQQLVVRYGKYVSKPDVTINIAQIASGPVVVLGEVNNPGPHQLLGFERLLDVISEAGGIKPDAGSEVLVTRQAKRGPLNASHLTTDAASGTSTATFPLDSLTELKTPGDNIVMEPGDTVSIPKGDLIYVVGDVHKSGGFVMAGHRSMSLLHAITLAEGLGPDNSAGKARILRPAPGGDGEMRQIPVDVPKIFAGKAPDVQLMANDVLFVPHSGFKVGSRRAIDAALGVATGVLIYR